MVSSRWFFNYLLAIWISLFHLHNSIIQIFTEHPLSERQCSRLQKNISEESQKILWPHKASANKYNNKLPENVGQWSVL